MLIFLHQTEKPLYKLIRKAEEQTRIRRILRIMMAIRDFLSLAKECDGPVTIPYPLYTWSDANAPI